MPRDAAFDAFVRQFGVNVFADPHSANFFVEFDKFVHFQDPANEKFLGENFFAATCDNVAYQLSSVGASFQSSINQVTYKVDFVGKLTAERSNADLRITNADGSQATLTKLDAVAASDVLRRLAFEPLPSARLPKYLAALLDGRYFYVDAPKYMRPIDDGFHAYLGTASAMRQVKVMFVESYRDGGTTRVSTDAGTLFIPVSLDPAVPAAQPSFLETATGVTLPVQLLDVTNTDVQSVVASFGIQAGADNLHVPTY